MAENKNAKKPAAAAAVNVEDSQKSHDDVRREKKKSRWTMESCMKIAKRFATRDEWKTGAPSCYKAAVSKGWDGECSAHMAVTKAPAAKKTAAKAPAKKGPGRLPKSA